MSGRLVDSVFIATFSPWKNGVRLPINGNLEPMRDYFTSRARRVVLIDQVYPGSDVVMPRIEVYEQGKLMRQQKPPLLMYFFYPLLHLTNYSGTQITFKIRDFLSVLFEGFRSPRAFDLFIGFEAVNALAGVFLRGVGKVKRVIYYVSDYSPNRYRTKWFNSLYLWLDRQAAMRSDVIWDVSPAMQPARIQAGLSPKKSAPVLIVPNALYPSQIKKERESCIEKDSLVFMGTLGVENGPDVAIEAMPIVLKTNPNSRLHIVGGGHDEKRLRRLSATLGVSKNVLFHGFIADREKVSELVRRFSVALAPYRNITGSPRHYGDATKIRAYMAAGLPTITTGVPPLGRIVSTAGAALMVEDNKTSLAKGILALLLDRKKWRSMRQAAIRFATSNTWENEYNKAMERTIA